MKGIIYCIECNDTGDKYIGSTTTRLIERIWKHRSDVKCVDNGVRNAKCKSYDMIKNNNYKYYVLEELEVDTRKDLNVRERHYIENTKCVNMVIPTRSKADSDRAYRNGPKREELLQKKRDYSKEHAEEIKAHRSQEIKCECGVTYQLNHKASHLRSLYHRRRTETELMEKDKKDKEDKRLRTLERNNRVCNCECGMTYTYGNRLRHFASNFHTVNL
jgi:hypothetical protein